MKRLIAAAGLAATLLSVAACNGIGGQPTPASDPTTGSPSTGGAPRSLADIAACSLLSSNDLTQLGVSSPPTPDQIGTARDCNITLGNGANAGVAIRTNQGLSRLSTATGPFTNLTIGSHQAAQQPNSSGTGGCLIVIGVTASSRVDVTTQELRPSDDGQSCPDALKVAQLIEPKLPS